MIERPVFHAHITVRVMDDDTVVLWLEEEGQERLLTGASCGAVARKIDGVRTADAIVDSLAGRVSPHSVYYALQRFEACGYLANADSDIPTGIQSFWAMLGANPENAAARLRNSAVSVCSIGNVDARAMEEALVQLGISIRPDAALRIVLTDDYLSNGLHELNREMLSAGAAWILGKVVGTTQWFGPIFRPGVTGCWCCLAHRLAENRAGALRRSHSGLPTTLRSGVNLMATEVAKWLVLAHSESLEGMIRTISADLTVATHRLTRRPQCHCCGELKDLANPFPKLQSRLRSQRTGHRAVTAEETLAILERHVSPITGIVPFLKRIDAGSGSFTTVYAAPWNRALAVNGEYPLQRSPGAAIGKGSSDSEAKAACLAEAMERYACSFHGDEQYIRARQVDLAPNAWGPRDLLQFSESQYAARDEWNAMHGPFQKIPRRYDDTCEIRWTEVWSATRDVKCYVPTAYCYLGCTLEPDNQFCAADSNGCASGNTVEEAILHGLLELVERDAVALWWYSRAKRPAITLGEFREPLVSAALESLRGARRTLHVLDITSDLGIPACVAVSWRDDGSRIVLGSAADLDPAIAVRRAVCEAGQMIQLTERPVVEVPPEARDVEHWLRKATIEGNDYVVPSGESQWHSLASGCSPDILDDVNRCIRVLEHSGLEVLVRDMTRPDTGFPTVRVIVPGLRHFWARLGPGRLYDVPPRMGWISRPLAEAELNPVPYML